MSNIKTRLTKLEQATGASSESQWLLVAVPDSDGGYRMRRMDGSQHHVTREHMLEIGRKAGLPVIVMDKQRQTPKEF